MIVAVPTEIKSDENRIALTPGAVRQLVQHGHQVLIQAGAGTRAGFPDEAYAHIGARMLPSAAAVFGEGELIVKVKEPLESEWPLLQPSHTLFTFLHLAPDPDLTAALISSGCTAIAYETVTDALGRLPLLAPMSEVAGRMSIQAGATALESPHGGAGVLLGGVPGTPPAKVTVLGGGMVGTNAARMAAGLEAYVAVLDSNLNRLRELDLQFGRLINTVYANVTAIEDHVLDANLVIGSALVAGAKAPALISREMIAGMKPGSVVVDVAIDQGGCAATSRPTTHAEPTFVVDNVVHYCVTNMPGAVARTSTVALSNATTPYVTMLADLGVKDALESDPHLLDGLNVCQGRLTHPGLDHLGDLLAPGDAIAALS